MLGFGIGCRKEGFAIAKITRKIRNAYRGITLYILTRVLRVRIISVRPGTANKHIELEGSFKCVAHLNTCLRMLSNLVFSAPLLPTTAGIGLAGGSLG
jgi:hypothetical protein